MRGGLNVGLLSPAAAAAAGRAPGKASHKGPLSRRRPAPHGVARLLPPSLSPPPSGSPLPLPCPGLAAPRDEAGLGVPRSPFALSPGLGEPALRGTETANAGTEKHHHGNALGPGPPHSAGFSPGTAPRGVYVGVGAGVHLETLGSWSGSVLNCVRSSRRIRARVGLRGTPGPRVLPGPLQRCTLSSRSKPGCKSELEFWILRHAENLGDVFSALNFVLIGRAVSCRGSGMRWGGVKVPHHRNSTVVLWGGADPEGRRVGWRELFTKSWVPLLF